MTDFQNSIEAYEKSRRRFEQVGKQSNVIYILADLSALYFIAEDYEKAQRYAEQSLAIARRIDSNQTEKALWPPEYGAARSLHTLGEIELRDGNHEGAINKLRESLALYEQLNGTGSSYNTYISGVLAALGKVYPEMGNYRQALFYLNRALQISTSSGEQNTLASILNSIGYLYLEQEDYAQAQAHFNESLTIYRSTKNQREEARVLLNLGVIKQRQGHHDDALMLFKHSMEVAKATQFVDVQIASNEGLGVVLTAKRNFTDAFTAMKTGLELARLIKDKTREVELLWRTAQTYYEMQNYRQSALLADQAMTLASSARLPKLTYLATATLGEAYAAEGKVELAIDTLKDAVKQIETLRDQVAGGQEGLQLFFESKIGPYHALVTLLTDQGNTFEALVYAERAKGRVLLDVVRSGKADLASVLDETERIEAQLLIKKISDINQRIKSQPTGDMRAQNELYNQLDAARLELASFRDRTYVTHPELRLRSGGAQALTLASLKTLIPGNDLAFLEYVVTNKKLGVFIVKRNRVTTETAIRYLGLSVNLDQLQRNVNKFHSMLAERHPNHRPLSRELYRLLIEPIANELQDVRTICIVPDGLLWTLPFQALTTKRGNYLVEQYALHYAPSLSVLHEMNDRTRQTFSNGSLIAFGNPVIGRDEKLNQDLCPLPEAETEVAEVAAAVRSKMNKVFVGREAAEKSFKALAPAYATIHLATHGVLDNRDPLYSHLLLTRTDGDVENDGSLEAREIMNMHLNADLAVLSACETGNGRISPGEGVIGMSWAFFVAGTRSLVVSQWRVNSTSTSQLMKGFYRALAIQRKAEALRQASLRMLKNPRYRHPFYWAGFVLVGRN